MCILPYQTLKHGYGPLQEHFLAIKPWTQRRWGCCLNYYKLLQKKSGKS